MGSSGPREPSLPLPDQILQSPECFFNWRHRIGLVQIVQVDPVRLQPPEAALDRRQNVAPRPALESSRLVHRHAELGGEDDILAPRAQDFPEDCFRPALLAIDIRRVEERDAEVQGFVNHLP